MRSTLIPESPPQKYPKLEFPVANKAYVEELNGPLTDAITVSLV